MTTAGDSVVAMLACRPDGKLGICDREALRAALSAAAALELPAVAIAATARGVSAPALRVALRAGCARAVAVEVDPGDLDYLDTAAALAGAVRSLAPRLVLCGDQSESHRRGAVGPAVAELLDIPHVSGVRAFEISDGALRCQARFESQSHTLAPKLPVLLTVRRAGQPAPRSGRGGQVVEPHTADESRPDVAPGGERAHSELSLNPRGGAVIIESAADLVRRLRDDHLIR